MPQNAPAEVNSLTQIYSIQHPRCALYFLLIIGFYFSSMWKLLANCRIPSGGPSTLKFTTNVDLGLCTDNTNVCILRCTCHLNHATASFPWRRPASAEMPVVSLARGYQV